MGATWGDSLLARDRKERDPETQRQETDMATEMDETRSIRKTLKRCRENQGRLWGEVGEPDVGN